MNLELNEQTNQMCVLVVPQDSISKKQQGGDGVDDTTMGSGTEYNPH